MIRKIIVLILLLTLVALVSYVFYLNLESVVLTYSPEQTISAPLGLILIGVFSLAVILTSAVFLLFIAWNRLQIRKLNKTLSKEQLHSEQIVRAREALATEDYDSAKSLLKKLNKKYPDDVVTRIMLAQALKGEGDSDEALRVLEDARAEQKENLELLYETALANERNDNFTAAYDNAKLMLKKEPYSKRALRLISYFASRLDRYDEAIETQKKLVGLANYEELEEEQETLAFLMFQKAEAETDESEKRSLLEELIRNHKNYSPALIALADLEIAANKQNAAEKLLFKAYLSDNDPSIIEKLLKLWPDNLKKSIASAKKAIENSAATDALAAEAHLLLVKTFLEQNLREEAKDELQKIKACSVLDGQEERISLIENILLNDSLDIQAVKRTISSIAFRSSF